MHGNSLHSLVWMARTLDNTLCCDTIVMHMFCDVTCAPLTQEVADGLASGPRLEPYEPPLEQPTSPEQPTGNEAAVTHSSSMPSSASSSAEKAACGGPVVSDSEPSDLIEKNNASILSGDGGPPP